MAKDLNHATARTLVNTTGIPHSLAQSIVNYRKEKQNCPITDLLELWKVPGMSSEDFEAISEDFTIPSNQRVTSTSPRNKNTSASNGNKSPQPGSPGPNNAKNRRKRARKKVKKMEQQELKNRTQSPRRSSLRRDCSRNSRSLNSKAINRNRTRNGSPNNSTLEGRIQVPNLFLNSAGESPHNTLIRLTGRNSMGSANMLAPFAVENDPNGNGIVIKYEYKTAPESGTRSNEQLLSPRSTFEELYKFSNVPLGRSRSKSPDRNWDLNEDSRSRSRSRRSTFSPIQKRSRSNPEDKTEFSNVNVQVLEEWGSNLPQGPGSSTLRSDITVPVNDAWAENDHENVRHWLETVRDENIISSSGSQGRRYRSLSAESRRLEDHPGEHKDADVDRDQPGPSGKQRSLNVREPNEFDGNYPSTSKGSQKRANPNMFKASNNPTKPLLDTWKETQEREKSNDSKKKESKSRHKSRPRFNNKVTPGGAPGEDERRPIETRLDRDRSTGLSAEERRKLRHRHRSKVRSRNHLKRRFLNCSVM